VRRRKVKQQLIKGAKTHLDPAQKRFAVSRKGATLGIRTLRAEAAKCVVLCANCHAEVEGGVATLPIK
jgi:hypothetical protein